MRDVNGVSCPATLGEYQDFVRMVAPASAAATFLEAQIAAATPDGRNTVVTDSHEAYMAVLQPKIVQSTLEVTPTAPSTASSVVRPEIAEILNFVPVAATPLVPDEAPAGTQPVFPPVP